MRIFTLGVGLPTLSGFLAVSAAHGGECFKFAARSFTWRARAGVGRALGLGDVAAHAPRASVSKRTCVVSFYLKHLRRINTYCLIDDSQVLCH